MNISQGDATLAGAVYGLYDGDKLVATATTDETGHYDFAGTYVVGDLWQVKEITAARGYLLDPVAYTVGACAEDLAVQTGDVYQAQLENATLGNGLVGEQVKKQSLSFYKVTGTDKESSYEAVAGAKFSIYRVADLADGKYVNVSDAELPQASLMITEIRKHWILMRFVPCSRQWYTPVDIQRMYSLAGLSRQ